MSAAKQPWSIGNVCLDDTIVTAVLDCDGDEICNMGNSLMDETANAERIVACVNNYAALEAENTRLTEERDNAIYARDGFMASLEKMAAERDDMEARLGIIERNTQDATARSLAQNTLAKRNGVQG